MLLVETGVAVLADSKSATQQNIGASCVLPFSLAVSGDSKQTRIVDASRFCSRTWVPTDPGCTSHMQSSTEHGVQSRPGGAPAPPSAKKKRSGSLRWRAGTPIPTWLSAGPCQVRMDLTESRPLQLQPETASATSSRLVPWAGGPCHSLAWPARGDSARTERPSLGA